MLIPRRRFLHLAMGAALPALTRAAWAQAFPSRTITIVVPYPAGGPVDLIARVLAEQMRGPLGQPVVVENAAGGGGTVGVGKVARAAPDGYTLSIGNTGSHVLNGALYSLAFDPLKDFAPIARLASNPQIIVSKKDIPATNLKELIAWLKDRRDPVSVGTAGPRGRRKRCSRGCVPVGRSRFGRSYEDLRVKQARASRDARASRLKD